MVRVEVKVRDNFQFSLLTGVYAIDARISAEVLVEYVSIRGKCLFPHSIQL